VHKTAAAGVLVGLLCSQCEGQVVAKQPQAPAPSVQVHHAKSEIDDEHWTILAVRAREPYRNVAGTSVRPELKVQCTQKGGDHSLSLILDSGPVQGEGDGAWLHTRLDNGEAIRYGWVEMSDHKSYRYNPNNWFESWLDKGPPRDLIESLLAGKTLLIEFQPFMVSSATVARFDVSGLRKEFNKAPECKLPTATVSP
jgi:hypothetical protein